MSDTVWTPRLGEPVYLAWNADARLEWGAPKESAHLCVRSGARGTIVGLNPNMPGHAAVTFDALGPNVIMLVALEQLVRG